MASHPSFGVRFGCYPRTGADATPLPSGETGVTRTRRWRAALKASAFGGALLLSLAGADKAHAEVLPDPCPIDETDPCTTLTTTQSITQTITVETINVTDDEYMTRVVGNLIGQGIVFDESNAFASGTAQFDQLVGRAGAAISAAGAPLFVRLLPPRLISHDVTSSISSSSVDTLVVAAPPHDGVTFQTDPDDPHLSQTTITTVGGFDGALIPNGFLGHCTSTGQSDSGATPGTFPSGCSGGDDQLLPVRAGTVNITINIIYNEEVLRTTTTTTTRLTSELWEVDGIAARLGTVHAVVPAAGFDQSEAFLSRTLAAGAADEEHSFRPWFEGWGSWNRTRGRDDIPGDRRHAYGLDGGFDLRVASGVRIGAAIDSGRTDIDLPSVGEHANVRLTELGATLGLTGGNGLFANVTASYGWGKAETRSTPVAADETSRADYHFHSRSFAAEAGIRTALGGIALTPAIGAETTRVATRGFTESGSNFGLSSAGGHFHRNRLWAGIEADAPMALSAGHVLTFAGSARAVHMSGDLAPVLAAGFGGDLDTAHIEGPRQHPWGADLRAGLNLSLAAAVDVYVSYETLLSDGSRAQAGRAGVRMRF